MSLSYLYVQSHYKVLVRVLKQQSLEVISKIIYMIYILHFKLDEIMLEWIYSQFATKSYVHINTIQNV